MATRLDIGAGRTRIPDFTNVDLSHRADVSLDLNRDRLPFEDDSVELVFTYHALEHLERYLFALGEIHRVLRHGCPLFVGVSYVTLTEYNLVNPYHRQHFNEHSFDFFDPERLKGSAVEPNDVLFRKVTHRFHYMEEFENESPEKKEWSRRHLFNVVRRIDFGILAIKQPERPLPLDRQTPEVLMRLFDECLARRVAYDRA